MSRTASYALVRSSYWDSIILCILIGFLGMHFMVEDSFFLTSAFPSPDKIQSTHLNIDEIEHQDDLVVLGDYQGRVAITNLPAAVFMIARFHQQPCFPILTPPKVS